MCLWAVRFEDLKVHCIPDEQPSEQFCFKYVYSCIYRIFNLYNGKSSFLRWIYSWYIRVVRHISRGSRNRNYLKLRSCIYWALNKQLSFCKFSCRYGNVLVLCCVLSCPVSKIKKIAIDICAVVRNHWLSQNKLKRNFKEMSSWWV